MNSLLNLLRKYGAVTFNKTTLWLFGRAIILALLWFYAYWWVFCIAAIFIFIRSQKWPYNLFSLFIITVIISYYTDIWLTKAIENTTLAEISHTLRLSFAGFFGLLFFLIIGIKELFFVKRREICLVVTTIIFFITTFLTIWSLYPGVLILNIIPFAIVAIVLGKSLSVFFEDTKQKRGITIFILVFTFLLIELLWVVSYSPFSIINSSILLTTFFFIVSSLYFISEKGMSIK